MFWVVSLTDKYFTVWDFTVETSLNSDLCHVLQYKKKIFPVNVNYSNRTALYVCIIKKKVILKETNSQHLLKQNNHGTRVPDWS